MTLFNKKNLASFSLINYEAPVIIIFFIKIDPFLSLLSQKNKFKISIHFEETIQNNR